MLGCEGVKFEIPCLSEERLQDAGWRGVGVAQRLLVLDELLDSGGEFH